MRHHRDVCHHGVMVDSPEDIEGLESWFGEIIERQGRTKEWRVCRLLLIEKAENQANLL